MNDLSHSGEGTPGGSRARVLALQVGNRPGPRICRSLEAAGFTVVGTHEPGRFRGRSRYCPSPLRTPSPELSPDLFLEAVERICRTHGIDAVLPGDDERSTRLLVTRLPRPGGAVVVGPDAEQYNLVCDKGNLHDTARAAGLDTPRAATVGLSDRGEPDWPPLPSVVKPRWAPAEGRGIPLRRSAVSVSTPAERDAAVALIHAAEIDALIEERIVGKAWRIHFVTDGRQTFAIPVITVRSFPPDAGESSVQVVPWSSPAELYAATDRLIAYLGYKGPGSFQFLERDGRFYLHDVNLRLPSSVGLSIAAGLDMPRLAVEVALGLETTLSGPVHYGARYVALEGELKSLLLRIRSREPLSSIWEVASDIALAAVSPRRVLDQFSVTDPLPTLALAAQLSREALRWQREGGGRRPTVARNGGS